MLTPGNTCCLQWAGRFFRLAGDETVSGHPDDHPRFRAHLLLRPTPSPRQAQPRHAQIFSHHQRNLPGINFIKTFYAFSFYNPMRVGP